MSSCGICKIFKNTFLAEHYLNTLLVTFEIKNTHASATDLLNIRIGNLDWNESHEKETKHDASAADFLHIGIGNIDWCKCGHCKNEAREIDCLCCREVDTILIVSARIPEREESISLCSFSGLLPTC